MASVKKVVSDRLANTERLSLRPISKPPYTMVRPKRHTAKTPMVVAAVRLRFRSWGLLMDKRPKKETNKPIYSSA